jgi:hypothetical protein
MVNNLSRIHSEQQLLSRGKGQCGTHLSRQRPLCIKNMGNTMVMTMTLGSMHLS